MSDASKESSTLRYEAHGDLALVPVVAQHHLTGEIRMLAWATAEAVEATLATGRAVFFSRSRRELWEKGKTSGNGMQVKSVLVDCDADALVYLVDTAGPSCHTGAPSCFFRRLGVGGLLEERAEPQTMLARLEEVLRRRKQATAEKSYAKSLYDAGPVKIGGKLREEADELARAVEGESDERVVSEAADVLFHVMVALRARDLDVSAVLEELSRRSGTSGHDEKKNRSKT